MNTKNNRRRRESIMRIENAFLELLQTKELHEVTVSDICKCCELNRSTFYANYVDIYDLADKVREHLEEDVNRLYDQEKKLKFNSNDYLKLFRHIRDNQLFYRTYFKLGYDNEYKVIAYDVNLAREHFHNQFVEYHMEFFRAGITQIIKLWLKNGCRESPEDMVEILKSEYRGRAEW